MKLTKRQIAKIKNAWRNAVEAEIKAQKCAEILERTINEITGVAGFINHLAGDGFGFTPASNNDTHIQLSYLIELAESGEDITEELILDNLSL